MLAWFTALAVAAPHVHVRDLDPTVLPARMEFSAGRLWVDGAQVRGSRGAQLDYLAVVLADAEGRPPAELRVAERHRALHRSAAASAVSIGATAAGTVAMIAFPPAILPILVGKGAVVCVSAGVGLAASHQWDQRELAAQVDRYHTFASIELP